MFRVTEFKENSSLKKVRGKYWKNMLLERKKFAFEMCKENRLLDDKIRREMLPQSRAVVVVYVLRRRTSRRNYQGTIKAR